MISEISEQQWFVSLLEGNEAAFNYFFQKHLRALVRCLYEIVDDTGEAEDMASEVFVKLWKKMKELDLKDPKHLENTLYLIGKRAAYTYLRDNKRLTARQQKWVALNTDEKDDFQEAMDNELLRSMILEEISRRFDNLPQRCKEVFELRYVKKMSVSEIAKLLDISYSTVCNHSSDAMKAFRDTLKENKLLLSLLTLFLRG